MPVTVEMKAITKRFGSLVANDNVDFDLVPGETHALVGENGAGKTTLMRILYGQYTADSGKILIDGKPHKYGIAGGLKLGISMVYQNFMQIETMSITDNVILGHSPKKGPFIDYAAAKRRVAELLERFNMKISPDTMIGNLCVGERQKIEIIKALYLGANILILDEPTAVLTPQESNELFTIIAELKSLGKSIVFISHKLREVIVVADRITVMRKGKVTANFSRGQVTEADIARGMIGKQEVSLLQNKKRGSTGDAIFQAKNLWLFDDNGLPRLKNFSITARKSEILGIGGVEGNGQSELIQAIIGTKRLATGEIFLSGQNISKLSIKQRRDAGIGYISEDRMETGLSLQSDVEENLICGAENDKRFSRFGFLNTKKISEHSTALIQDFDIRGVQKKKTVKQLSGGNMQKIILAREIGRDPKLLIAAQPTRGLDIGAINFVRKQLLAQRNKGSVIILVSADLEELMSLSDRIVIMYEGTSTGEILSNELENGIVTENDIGLMMGGISRKGRSTGNE